MNLPIYQIIYLKSGQIEELNIHLVDQINFRGPVVFELAHLDQDQQRETIGIIENYFSTKNISYLFPYPVYISSSFNESISHMPMVKSQADLPRFFKHKDGKLMPKDSLILNKNKLYQQEIKNSDPTLTQLTIKRFSAYHKRMHIIEHEKNFYQNILTKING